VSTTFAGPHEIDLSEETLSTESPGGRDPRRKAISKQRITIGTFQKMKKGREKTANARN
jgi:hypothetical protein